jgi:gluconolactonase
MMPIKKPSRYIMPGLALVLSIILLAGCVNQPSWWKTNKALIEEYGLEIYRRSDIPDTGIIPNIEPGQVISLDDLQVIEFYPGVSAKIYWGHGALVSIAGLEANAEIPREILSSNRFVFVTEGEIKQLVGEEMVSMISRKREEPDGIHATTPRMDFVYLEAGSTSAVVAGDQGACIIEVFSPVAGKYLGKAEVTDLPSRTGKYDFPVPPSITPGMVYNLYDLQYTELVPGANSRIVAGNNIQLSFLTMDPESSFARHIHPEEQLMLVFRGGIDEIIMDGEYSMEPGDILLLPGNMIHGGTNGPLGCDVLDIFWPSRVDYNESMQERLEAYHGIIPGNARVKLIIDGEHSEPGLTFTEGPCWLDGRLYFSNMYFEVDWTGDPGKSNIVEMEVDGSYRYISSGSMQSNGLAVLGNGNLAVCDMFGHRVVEMTPGGRVVGVLADSYEGEPLDGPNDLVVDARGGIYFTDPQFTPDVVKNQPGRCVYYLNPEGGLIRVIEPDVFAMPNGVILSLDGKTLYINNTYDDEEWWNVDSDKDQYVWAYDVNDDGTLSNGRAFAKLFLTGNVLDREGKTTSADGMAIDRGGNLYVATLAGLQIFNNEGVFTGIVNFPTFPVSVCFGGEDMQTLYITSYDKIYSVLTRMKGYIQHQ